MGRPELISYKEPKMGKKYVKCTTKSPGLVVGKPYEVVGASPSSYVIKVGTGKQAYSSSYFTDISNDDMGQVCGRCNRYVNADYDTCDHCDTGDCLHPRILDDMCQNCQHIWNSKHTGDRCYGGGTYKPSYEVVVVAAVPTTQYGSDDWRAWRNARPGECPCGTNKEACWIHKDL